MNDERRLIEKLQRIEALHAGAATSGEQEAAVQGQLAFAEPGRGESE